MKRVLLLILCIALLSVFLIGCGLFPGLRGDDNNTPDPGDNNGDIDEPNGGDVDNPPPPPPPPPPDPSIDGDLSDIMAQIYDNLGEDVQRPFVEDIPLYENMDRNGGIQYFLGTTGIPFAEAIASEAMIGAIAHSLILLRMQPNTNINAVMDQLRDSINPWKWVCVGTDGFEVVNIGNLIFVAVSDYSDQYREAFLQLAG
jgi:hypothetical protein